MRADLSPKSLTFLSGNAAQSLAFSKTGARTKAGRSLRQQQNGPDLKPSNKETGFMASQAHNPIQSKSQRYARPVPIGEAALNVLAALEKRVGK